MLRRSYPRVVIGSKEGSAVYVRNPRNLWEFSWCASATLPLLGSVSHGWDPLGLVRSTTRTCQIAIGAELSIEGSRPSLRNEGSGLDATTAWRKPRPFEPHTQ